MPHQIPNRLIPNRLIPNTPPKYNYPTMTPKISQIIRSNRKTFGLEVKPNGQLIARAPKSASDRLIHDMVAKKAGWIKKTQARLSEQYPDLAPKKFRTGEQFWYLGETYPLLLTERQRPPLDLDGAFLLSREAQHRAKKVFIEWYREETRKITNDLIQKYVGQYRFRVSGVRVTSARTRWGSCSGKNNLNFTYRLSMAPLHIIDYVVVHELVHLRIKNHSKKFWQAVGEIKPDYRKNRQWLKDHGPLLTLD